MSDGVQKRPLVTVWFFFALTTTYSESQIGGLDIPEMPVHFRFPL